VWYACFLNGVGLSEGIPVNSGWSEQTLPVCPVSCCRGGKHLKLTSCMSNSWNFKKTASNTPGTAAKQHIKLIRQQIVENDWSNFTRLDHVTYKTLRRVFSKDYDSLRLAQPIVTVLHPVRSKTEVVYPDGSWFGGRVFFYGLRLSEDGGPVHVSRLTRGGPVQMTTFDVCCCYGWNCIESISHTSNCQFSSKNHVLHNVMKW